MPRPTSSRDWLELAYREDQLENKGRVTDCLQFAQVIAAVETAESLGRIADDLAAVKRLLAERQGYGCGESICAYPEAG